MMVGKNTGSTETAKRIPIDSIGVEIGVWRGDTTDKFIKNAKKKNNTSLILKINFNIIIFSLNTQYRF